MKKCYKCGEIKDEFCFHKDKTRKSGLNSSCKQCKKISDHNKHLKNRDRNNKRCREYHNANRELILHRKNEYYKDNSEKEKLRNNIWRKNNRKKVAEYKRKYQNKRYRTDYNFRITLNLRNLLNQAYRKYSDGKKYRSRQLGIDFNKIIEHLGICPGPRKDYHIDHIKPLCLFDFNKPEQIKAAFAPENHQWLLKEENMSKGGKYNA